ncbi:MAG: hypothetical protein IH798_06905 [Gemmatimonadetes bacterium]|nr:hypothetical protein [Gemmatimonadota bacterium]
MIRVVPYGREANGAVNSPERPSGVRGFLFQNFFEELKAKVGGSIL